MKKLLHKIELIVDKLVPCMLILLLIIIVLDLGFHEIAEQYTFFIKIGDFLVVGVFSLDLLFKYIRIRKIPKFLRTCWLDIIAIFPFFLAFRVLEGFLGIFSRTFAEGFSTAQGVMHEGVEAEREASRVLEGIEKEGARVAGEAGKAGKISRTQRFARVIRPLFRLPRFGKVFTFFEKPTGEHYIHELKVTKSLKKGFKPRRK